MADPDSTSRFPSPENSLHVHSTCHLGGRLAAWVDQDNRLTVACGECWQPIVVVADHHGLFAGMRALAMVTESGAGGGA